MAKKTCAQANDEAKKAVERWTLAAGMLGVIPGAGALITWLVDGGMTVEIATIYGVDTYDAEAIAAMVGAAVTGQLASMIFLSFIPILGWIINAGIAAAVTRAVGEMLMEHFRGRSPYCK